MDDQGGKARLLAQIAAERAYWHDLVSEVGPERLAVPGPMGAWTFLDLAAHLTGWRERTIGRLLAGPGTDPPPPWPASLHDDDEINAWIREQHRDHTPQAILDQAERSYDRLAAAIRALPEEDVVTPGRFPWLQGGALATGDFFGHLHEEHEPAVRAWLARDR